MSGLRAKAAIVGVADAVSPTGELEGSVRALEVQVIREALDDAGLAISDVDAVFAYCEEGPEIYLHLEQIDTVMPRDLQLLVLCTIDCEMNARLGITHLCLHPEKAPEGMFAALDAGDPPRAIELPYELVRGSTTR